MFRLSDKPLEEEKLLKEFNDPEAGACVSFIGRVRIKNRDRKVVRLEYEAAEQQTAMEFAKIVAELRTKYDVGDVRCVHRVGTVGVGEIAVWIGVTSVHRSPAFSACQYVIDELKKRLPIWKKEHYADGESEWLNAEKHG